MDALIGINDTWKRARMKETKALTLAHVFPRRAQARAHPWFCRHACRWLIPDGQVFGRRAAFMAKPHAAFGRYLARRTVGETVDG